MIFPRSLLLLLPIVVLGMVGFAASALPVVEPGLQVAKSGIVLDAQTGQPLVGAYVVVRWLEQSRAAASGRVTGQCLKRIIVRTDDDGHYAIPATEVALTANRVFGQRDFFWDSSAYTPGYTGTIRAQHPRARASSAPAVQDLEPMLLTADHARPEQRVIELADSLSRFRCEPFANELGPVAEQIYAEAYAAACLPEPNGAAGSLARLRSDWRGAKPCESFRQAGNYR